MTIDNFIPTVWSGKLLVNLNDAHVYAARCNTDYEGDVKQQGDAVKINSIGRVTVKAYTKGSTIDAPEKLDDAQQILRIDQADYFNFDIPDVDKWQQKPKLMDAAMQESAWAMSDVVDAYIAGQLEANVATANQLTAVTSVGTGATDNDAYETLVDLDVKLTENNVPSENRWVVVPPWYHGMLRKDPRFVSFGTDANRSNLRGTAIGKAANLTLYESNNVPVNVAAYTVIAGHSIAATFAEQIDKVEAFRPQNDFSDAMKGLHIYGSKITRPNALASVVATAAT